MGFEILPSTSESLDMAPDALVILKRRDEDAMLSFVDTQQHDSMGKIDLNHSIVGLYAPIDGAGSGALSSDGIVFSVKETEARNSADVITCEQQVIDEYSKLEVTKNTHNRLVSRTHQVGAAVTAAYVSLMATFGGANNVVHESHAVPLSPKLELISAYPSDNPRIAEAQSGGMPNPNMGVVPTPDGKGHWLYLLDGEVIERGDATYYGSAFQRTPQPIVDMKATKDGGGYVLVDGSGAVISRGDAQNFGSIQGNLTKPIVGEALTPSGRGYWLVASDGGIFAFGDAPFLGSTGAMRLNRPIVGMAPTPSGNGYRFVASDGGIFDFGDAPYFGSAANQSANVVGMATTTTGNGYWLAKDNGGVDNFGDAPAAN